MGMKPTCNCASIPSFRDCVQAFVLDENIFVAELTIQDSYSREFKNLQQTPSDC